MKTFINSLLFMLIIQNFSAQQGKITGTVKSEDGTPIDNLNIVINDQSSKTTKNGEFVFDQLNFGTYSLKFSKNGFEDQLLIVQLNNAETTVSVVMKIKTKNLGEIKIVSVKTENEKSVEIGKIPIRAFDLPQSSAVISEETIDQQQSMQMSDVLKNTNGVYIMGTSGGYQEEIAGRGFAFGSSNTFKNGVRFNNAIMPEISSLEKMEVLKGSTAILFGNVAAGGVLNLVTKKPKFEKGGEIAMTIASYSFYKPTIDVYGSLNKKNTIAYRMNSSYQNSKSFRDVVAVDRFYINPSLLFLVGKKTQILLEGDYLKDERTADFGVGAINYQLIDIPRNTFLGTSWSTINTKQSSFNATTSYQLSKNWQLKNVTAASTFQNDLFSNVRPNASGKFIKEDGTWIRGIQRTQVDEQYYLTQLDLTSKFNTGKIKHALLLGGEIDQYYTNTTAYNGISTYDTINIYNIDIESQRKDIPSLTRKTNTRTPRTRTGVYIQDLVSITEKIKFLAGIRFSYLESSSNIYTYSTELTTNSKTYDHAFSPRLGLVFQPIKTISIFSSYSNSFTPNTGVTIEGDPLEPSIIDQYEIGVKNDFFKGLLSFNVTAYQITNSNVAQMVLENGNTNSNIKELAGEIMSKGIEVDIATKSWKGLTAMAGYSYNQTKYIESTIYAAGTKLLYQPKDKVNTSLYYEFEQGNKLKGLNFGLTAMYFGERFGGRLTRLTVPNDTYKPIELAAYSTLDASVGYSRNNFSLRFRVSNIFNAMSYNVHDDNSVNPIAPRMYTTTLTIKL